MPRTRSSVTTTLLKMCALFAAGVAVGYCFGYDHGWEKAVAYIPNPPMDRDGRREDSGRG